MNITTQQKIKIAEVIYLPVKDLHFIEGNRSTQVKHEQKMFDLISENGFADTIKVAKSKNKYRVIEGQHRLNALRELGVEEVPCSVIDWIGDDFDALQQYIIDLNAHNKQWTLYDYVKSWSDKKIYEYIHLRRQLNEYKHTLSNGVVASVYDGENRRHNALKEGRLKFKNIDLSEEMIEIFSNLVGKYGKTLLKPQMLGNAAMLIHRTKRKDVLNAFSIAVNAHLATSNPNPIPVGDEDFKHWFDYVIPEILNR